MRFTHTYPEVQGLDLNLMDGQTPTINGVAMEKLRLRQLRDLARAYQIKIDMDAPKPRILPALMAAASDGTFQKRPALDYYFRRAHRTGDEKDEFEHPEYENTDGAAVVAPVPRVIEAVIPPIVPTSEGFGAVVEDEPEEFAGMKYPELRSLARRCDPNVGGFGVKRSEYIRVIESYVKEHGHVPDGS